MGGSGMTNGDAGPFSIEPDCFGQSVPCYALTFDKKGLCTSPKTLDDLGSLLEIGKSSDVILFSHGWNNDWPTARKRYMDFLKGVSATAERHKDVLPIECRPVFVGIHWPSIILTWPSERPPDIAGNATDPDETAALDLLRDLFEGAEQENFDKLVAHDKLDVEQAREFAALLAPRLLGIDDASEVKGTFETEDLVTIWRTAGELTANSDEGVMAGGGFQDFDSPGQAAVGQVGPAPAGLMDTLSLRNIARLATVLVMKDRAGIVGAAGVAEVVQRILDRSQVRLHLVGHSYGAKVVMTALVQAKAKRRAHSAFLLQPAISHLAFAADIGGGKPGGFRSALTQVSRPIFATYSSNDFPLCRVFHWAARRRTDLGEIQALGGPPSKYAALGGYGPSGMLPGEVWNRTLPGTGETYGDLAAEIEILALNGATGIMGHGDITNPYTFWAMLNQMT
jgi:hypothetical protein